MYYQEEIISQILNDKNNNIAKLALKANNFHQEGNLYVTKCPFHHGKQEDFFVNNKTNTWYCPVCGESGNQISFIMKLKDYNFENALRFLAKRAKIALPEPETVNIDNSVFYDINRDAARFFYKNLTASVGLEYFKKRQLSIDTLIKFRLGYAPPSKDALYKYLSSLGYQKNVLLKSGLIGISAKGEYYDKFRNRVMYPIINQDNKFIGFGGRVLDDSKPKYLNSQATPVFDKKQNLYGFNYAQNTKMNHFIFCEGFMDTIAMHQAGFDNAVASLGTALTQEQVALISNYTDNVFLAYDSDGPGVSAALRAIELFNAKDITCKIINMAPAKDPDEYIKRFGRESFLERIESAEDSEHFYIRKLKEKYPDEKNKFYEEAIGILLQKGENN